MATYKCSKCGVAVIVIPGEEPIRACKHEGAAIIADASTHIIGSAKLSIK